MLEAWEGGRREEKGDWGWKKSDPWGTTRGLFGL